MSADLLGVVPAAGRGVRSSPLPCSKEVFPIGFREDGDGAPRPKPAALHLLEKMVLAGTGRAVIVLREGKWDIPAYLGHGRGTGLDLAYVVMRRPYGVPYSVDDAYAFVRNATVLFGFPDIVSRPDDMFGRLLAGLGSSGADVVLAVFPRRPGGKGDGLSLDEAGEIREWDTSQTGDHDRTWIAAAWRPGFTEFLHDLLAEEQRAAGPAGDREMSMGEAMTTARRRGVPIAAVRFDEGCFIDIGTPDDLAAAVRDFAREGSHG